MVPTRTCYLQGFHCRSWICLTSRTSASYPLAKGWSPCLRLFEAFCLSQPLPPSSATLFASHAKQPESVRDAKISRQMLMGENTEATTSTATSREGKTPSPAATRTPQPQSPQPLYVKERRAQRSTNTVVFVFLLWIGVSAISLSLSLSICL